MADVKSTASSGADQGVHPKKTLSLLGIPGDVLHYLIQFLPAPGVVALDAGITNLEDRPFWLESFRRIEGSSILDYFETKYWKDEQKLWPYALKWIISRELSLPSKLIIPTSAADLSFLSKINNFTVKDVMFRKASTKNGLEIQSLRGFRGLLSLSVPGVDDEFLQHVASSLDTLQILDLESTKVTNEGLKALAKLKSLRHLCLSNCVGISDKGLRHLRGLSTLQRLELNGDFDFGSEGTIEGHGLKHLAKLNLQHLSMQRLMSIGDVGLPFIGAITTLQRLDISGMLGWCKITMDSLPSLSGLINLKILHLGCDEVQDEGLIFLKPLVRLEELGLKQCSLSGAGLVHVKDFADLRSVAFGFGSTYCLSGNFWERIRHPSDEGLSACFSDGGFTRLEHLSITGECQDTGLTDEGLVRLTAIPSLRRLKLNGTSVTLTFASQLSWLTSLTVTESNCLDDYGMHEICHRLLGLTELSISYPQGLKDIEGVELLTDDAFAFLHQLARLQTVCFDEMPSSVSAENILKKLPALPDLIHATVITDDPDNKELPLFADALISEILNSCPKLKWLNVSPANWFMLIKKRRERILTSHHRDYWYSWRTQFDEDSRVGLEWTPEGLQRKT